jgi:hypothetical protein
MNKPRIWLLALSLGLLLICGNAAAQGQPIGNGIYACDGAAQAGPCQPEGDDESSYSSSGGYTDNDYAHAEPKWADRWGAIAADPKNAKLGVAVNMESEIEAKQAALQDCQKVGGSGCSVEIAYYNQCAVLVTGDSRFNTSRGPTIEAATKYAMDVCNGGDENCRVYYSGCSLPERIQ